ncbi:TrmB family transcriptional regulator [Salinarchaeum laminariae]|uniref:TrmB family transcriptional regulator n=1 Tax=Salinarchaeum laminariae TaxID=869888 RepID=UPI0020C0CCAD|nr:helix-turn-helix domain-containing protein [Salinarchaeum laminariae]
MTDPAAALQRLGLSKYEAEVFVALQQIDSGTASDTATIADVPRSQVYGAAEDLEERGLVDIQHGSPKRYRAVSLEEARSKLRRDFEREHERAFESLEELDARYADREPRQEEIWTVSGAENVNARIESFVTEAEESIQLGTGASRVTDELRSTLVQLATDVDVTVISADSGIEEPFRDTDVETVILPVIYDGDSWPDGRFVVVDERTVLLSVIAESGSESAFWSEDTDFAAMLVRLLEGHVDKFVEL